VSGDRPTALTKRACRRDMALVALRRAGRPLTIGELADRFPSWGPALDVAVRDLESARLVANRHGRLYVLHGDQPPPRREGAR
jgi:hypothetical protein